MVALLAALLSVVITFSASLAVERIVGRSSRGMITPGWYCVFGLATPFFALVVYFTVPGDSPYLYGAYGLAGGIASVLAQCLYGTRLKERQE